MPFWPDDDGYLDDFDYEGGDYYDDVYYPKTYTYTCKYCKKGGFTWTKTSKGPRLQDENGILHLCLTDKAKKRTQERTNEAKQRLHEISVALNGSNPSIDEINRMLIDASYLDKLDK